MLRFPATKIVLDAPTAYKAILRLPNPYQEYVHYKYQEQQAANAAAAAESRPWPHPDIKVLWSLNNMPQGQVLQPGEFVPSSLVPANTPVPGSSKKKGKMPAIRVYEEPQSDDDEVMGRLENALGDILNVESPQRARRQARNTDEVRVVVYDEFEGDGDGYDEHSRDADVNVYQEEGSQGYVEYEGQENDEQLELMAYLRPDEFAETLATSSVSAPGSASASTRPINLQLQNIGTSGTSHGNEAGVLLVTPPRENR